MLDNASDDGSAEPSRLDRRCGRFGERVRLIERDRARRQGRKRHAAAARGAAASCCLLLNEDSELRPGAAAALIAALGADPGAAAAGAQLLDPAGNPQPCAWRLPGLGTVARRRRSSCTGSLVTESGGAETRQVGWVQSAAMLVRREAAEQVGYLDPGFFVYSDETDFCKRLRDAGCEILYVPAARADPPRAARHRPLRRRAPRRPSSTAAATSTCESTTAARRPRSPACSRPGRYLPRALAALVLPGHDPGWYLAARPPRPAPGQGEGLREAADDLQPAPRERPSDPR